MFEFLFKYPPLVWENGRFVFGSPVSPVALGLVGAVVVFGSVWTYARVRRSVPMRDRMVLGTLRVLLFAMVLFCLFRPALLISTSVPQRNYVGVVIDDSRSMQIAEDGEPRSAWIERNFAAPDADLLRALGERFQLRFFRFAGDAGRLTEIGDLRFAGDRSEIGPALTRASDELAPVPLSGLVLVSDGADNSARSLPESLLGLRAAGVPVFAVGLGRETWERDLEVGPIETPRSVLQGSSLVLEVPLVHSGYAGRKVPLVVEDEGQIVSSQEIELPGSGDATTARVSFTPSETGLRRFRFRVPSRTVSRSCRTTSGKR